MPYTLPHKVQGIEGYGKSSLKNCKQALRYIINMEHQ